MSHAPRRALAWLLPLAVASACADDPAPAAPAPVPTPPACVCEEKEDCRACYEHIGECCYGDVTFVGQVAALAANCDRDGACSSCCNECVSMSCEDLAAAHDCPIPKI